MSRLKLTIPNKEKEQYNRIIDAMASKLSELLGYIHELETQIWECKCVIQGWLRN